MIQCSKCRSAYDNCCSLYCQSTLTTPTSSFTTTAAPTIVKNRQLLPRKLIKSSTAASTATIQQQWHTDTTIDTASDSDISASVPPIHTNSETTKSNYSKGANIELKVDGSLPLPIPTKQEKRTGNIMIDQRAAAIEEYCKRYVM